jgi:hypothetical protein
MQCAPSTLRESNSEEGRRGGRGSCSGLHVVSGHRSIAFDKLKYLETLKASGISEAQARAHTEALAQAVAEVPDLATKSDLDGRARSTWSCGPSRLS